ncbi:MAG: CoA pyrophosphatase [Bacteroidia bacterium]|nr:CoA pyrophosphatase [Bacteroidales bacterium]MDD3961384.1 CoA pyrophosphatase [Bacteroidales bacterium]MDY0286279.1 CoA pyrophosphatase [Bacteroidales bacterium]NCD41102.1 CoA pyrophosphatase [Bacteroidia bacterium]HPE86201.1 CoA pyrophosphatase [Bacteroidales bacterium]
MLIGYLSLLNRKVKYIENIIEALQTALPGPKAHHEMLSELRVKELSIFTHPVPAVDAAVLILLYQEDNRWWFPLIKRVTDNHVHSGQIALPGGKYEIQDRDLEETAIREATEEIGIAGDRVTRIGKLTSLYIAPSNYNVTPFIGLYNGKPNFIPDKTEVDYIIPVSVDAFRKKESRKNKTFNVRGLQFESPCFEINGHTIWGATAMILNEFLTLSAPHHP